MRERDDMCHIYEADCRQEYGGEKTGWRDLPIGAVITEPGSAQRYATGNWRAERAVWLEDKCIQCFFCWVHCPDSAIIAVDGQVRGIDYFFCKGCGVCDQVCPVDAIYMVPESDVEATEQTEVAPGDSIRSLEPDGVDASRKEGGQ